MILRACLAAAWLLVAPAASAQTTSLLGNASSSHPGKPKPVSRHATAKTASRPSSTRTVPAKAPARHVPVVAPKHKLPARTAVAAAKRVPLRKEPPPAPAVVPAPAKPAPPPVPADVGTNTGLHLPRYASLKSDDVNMRVGPAERYPVIWTYKRRELPVRIEREFDIWRLVEDMDGVKGWVHQATLTGRRTFVITGTAERTMRADASETADAVAILKPGVVGRIKSCEAGKDWCQVQVADYHGWLQRADVWGVDAGEVVGP